MKFIREKARCRLVAAAVSAAVCSSVSASGVPVAHLTWDSSALYGGTSGLAVAGAVSRVMPGMNIGNWKNYTYRAVMPEFSRSFGYQLEFDVGILSDHEYLLMPGFTDVWPAFADTRLDLEFSANRLSPTGPGQGDWYGSAFGPTFDEYLFAPGVSQRLGDYANLDVAAVFANQRYATWGLSEQVGGQYGQRYNGLGFEERSAGNGVRLGLFTQVSSAFEMGLSYQSRIDMDEFQSYRGVFSEPGDFDIPASANLGLRLRTTPDSNLSFDVQRVMYSEVNTFTTAALPDRFLSLLGDSGSPEFNWQDLTIYRLGWNVGDGENWNWRVEYSSRQQPLPTSPILLGALQSDIADKNVAMGFSAKTGRHSRFEVAASYAPSEYFLGPVHYGRDPDLGDDQVEFQFRMVWGF